ILNWVAESAALEDNLRKALWATSQVNDGQLTHRLFTAACNDALWEGLAAAISAGHTATAKKVWTYITERDSTHSARAADVLASLESLFKRSIEDGDLHAVAFFCDNGILKPSLSDVGRAMKHMRLDILRYFCDAVDAKRVAANDLRAMIESWADSRTAFEASSAVFDLIITDFDIVHPVSEVVYKKKRLSRLLLRATRNMKDQRLKNYIQDSRYRRK
ncbi:hypothetical protein HK405_001989, partial [Cladochytrium tenue]